MLSDRAIRADVKQVLYRCATCPSEVVAIRSTALGAFRSLSGRLSPLRARWSYSFGCDSLADGIKLPLIQFAVSHFAYDDDVFAYDRARGMPIAGDVPACATLTHRARPAKESAAAWNANLVFRNRQILDRAIKSETGPLAQDCWGKTMQEVRNGWVDPPVPVAEALLNSAPITPRLTTPENHDGRARKIGAIGDCRAPGINETMSTCDTSAPQAMGIFLARAAYLGRISPPADILALWPDFPHAYMHVPVLSSQEDFASILTGVPNGAPCVAKQRSHPFGSLLAPPNWAHVTGFLKWFP